MDMEPVIVLTGFAPFRNHTINASWETVKELQANYSFEGYKLVCEEIIVSYCDVDKQIPELWQKYNPVVVIHVGVSHLTSVVQIEKQACRIGYEQNDCLDNAHPTGCVIKDGADIINTGLDVHKICDMVQEQTGIKCNSSENAGRYLCEYTYYTSLNLDCARTLFIHVPILNEPYSTSELAKALYQIILCALMQLPNKSDVKSAPYTQHISVLPIL